MNKTSKAGKASRKTMQSTSANASLSDKQLAAAGGGAGVEFKEFTIKKPTGAATP